MLSLSRGNYTSTQVDAQLHSSVVEWHFSYDLLDKNNVFKKTLTTVISGHVGYDTTQKIRRTAKFTMQDDSSVNFLSDRIQPHALLLMPDGGYADFPLGVFILSTPPRVTDTAQVITRQIDAYDLLQVLVDDKVATRYTVTSGTNYITAVQTLLISSLMQNFYAQTVLNDQPTAYYKLNETSGTTSHDISPNALNGSIHGGVTLGAQGLLATSTDTSMQFDGSTGYISVPDNNIVNVTNAITIEAWVNPQSSRTTDAHILSREGDYKLQLLLNGNIVWLLNNTSGWGTQPTSVGTIPNGQVSHIVATYDSSTNTGAYYINGVLDSTFSSTGAIVNANSNDLCIGIRDDISSVKLFDGLMSDVALYDHAITSQQVKNHYNAGKNIIPMNLTATSSTLPNTLDWSPGTEKLQIINDLLTAINYRSLWFDENGQAQAIPYQSPSVRAPEYTYIDDSKSVMFPDMTQSLDLFAIPNEWVLTVTEPDRTVITSTYTNTNPNSPTSTVNRGRTIVKLDNTQQAPDQATLDAIASKMAYTDSQVYEQVEFGTAISPIHSDTDVFNLTYSVLDITYKVSETAWDFDLVQGARMIHRVQNVVSV